MKVGFVVLTSGIVNFEAVNGFDARRVGSPGRHRD